MPLRHLSYELPYLLHKSGYVIRNTYALPRTLRIFVVTSNYGWTVVTHLGSASLLIPILLLQCVALWPKQPQLVKRWLLAVGFGICTTLGSKILFMGWGLGSTTWDFTGISGHALFASSMYPILFSLRSPHDRPALRYGSFGLGFALAVAVGASRVVLGAHSVSEVLLGNAIGLAVSLTVLSAMQEVSGGSRMINLAPLLVLLLALDPAASQILPTHSWEVKLALWASGHQKPFTRKHLHPNRPNWENQGKVYESRSRQPGRRRSIGSQPGRLGFVHRNLFHNVAC
jgi:membrane-associated phospholipid phosphatase